VLNLKDGYLYLRTADGISAACLFYHMVFQSDDLVLLRHLCCCRSDRVVYSEKERTDFSRFL